MCKPLSFLPTHRQTHPRVSHISVVEDRVRVSRCSQSWGIVQSAMRLRVSAFLYHLITNTERGGSDRPCRSADPALVGSISSWNPTRSGETSHTKPCAAVGPIDESTLCLPEPDLFKVYLMGIQIHHTLCFTSGQHHSTAAGCLPLEPSHCEPNQPGAVDFSADARSHWPSQRTVHPALPAWPCGQRSPSMRVAKSGRLSITRYPIRY